MEYYLWLLYIFLLLIYASVDLLLLKEYYRYRDMKGFKLIKKWIKKRSNPIKWVMVISLLLAIINIVFRHYYSTLFR